MNNKKAASCETALAVFSLLLTAKLYTLLDIINEFEPEPLYLVLKYRQYLPVPRG